MTAIESDKSVHDLHPSPTRSQSYPRSASICCRTRKPGRRRRCGRRWRALRSVTSRSATIRPPICCASGSRNCSARKPRCSCRRAPCATSRRRCLIAGPATKSWRKRARISWRAKAARMPRSAASRSRRCRAPTASSRPRRFATRCIRARATSRRRSWSASSRPPISAAARSGRKPRSMRSSRSRNPTASPRTWTARGC